LYRRCDVAVIEVGLGGRFDSTDVCRPLVSGVPSLGLDHTAPLGHTPEETAYQKAGIIKRGAAAVSGVTEPGPTGRLRRGAARAGTRLIERARDFRYTFRHDAERSAAAEIVTPRGHYRALPLGLLGEHQAANAAVAVAAVEQLRGTGMPIPDSAIRAGLRDVR